MLSYSSDQIPSESMHPTSLKKVGSHMTTLNPCDGQGSYLEVGAF